MASKRRQIFVNPRLQLALIFGANALALISSMLLVTAAIVVKTHIDDYATGLNLVPGHPALAFIAERQRDFDRVCLLAGVIQFAIFNAAAIFMSHRIAGPLHRLTRHLDTVGAGGNPADLAFRKGDFFADLATACNRVMARMRGLLGAK